MNIIRNELWVCTRARRKREKKERKKRQRDRGCVCEWKKKTAERKFTVRNCC